MPKRIIKVLTSSGEEIGHVRKITRYDAPGFSELTLRITPHYQGMKRIEAAALDGVIVVDGLERGWDR